MNTLEVHLAHIQLTPKGGYWVSGHVSHEMMGKHVIVLIQ